jgi:thiol:disulfide interchange protein DsbD
VVIRRSTLSLWLVLWSLLAPAGAAGLLDGLDSLGGGPSARQFLPPDEAFRFLHEETPEGLMLQFEIATDYYLYRDKLQVEALAPGLEVGPLQLPVSEPKDDPEFGRVEIYRDALSVPVTVTRTDLAAEARLRVSYQGCAEDGICYPPIRKEIALAGVAGAPVAPQPSAAAIEEGVAPKQPSRAAMPLGETDRIAQELASRSLGATVLWFLLAGLALALTPCVFPMVPILTGIIVGQERPLSGARSFSLSLVYVLAMAGTYALVGLIAGMFGRNLQASFQHPAILVGFSVLFVLLALSMFGFFHLQVPAFIQTRLEATSRRQRGGSLLGVAAMGVLSAVIVGPCVAPPLAAALLYLSHQGSPVTGGLALFALGLGMGAPLLVLGASAGRLLPRTGPWMEAVKQGFGVVFLALAVWFLERLIPAPAALALWAVLAIAAAIYLGALEPLRETATGWQRFWKGLGLALLCYGVVLLVGAAAGAQDPLKPLGPLAAGRLAHAETPLKAFMPVKGEDGFAAALAAAKAANQPVLLDFYADWCIECKRLERNTFADPSVQAALAGFRLLRADVTSGDAADQALLARFELHGPPAVLLFNAAGVEQRHHRLIGYLEPAAFRALLGRFNEDERP